MKGSSILLLSRWFASSISISSQCTLLSCHKPKVQEKGIIKAIRCHSLNLIRTATLSTAITPFRLDTLDKARRLTKSKNTWSQSIQINRSVVKKSNNFPLMMLLPITMEMNQDQLVCLWMYMNRPSLTQNNLCSQETERVRCRKLLNFIMNVLRNGDLEWGTWLMRVKT